MKNLVIKDGENEKREGGQSIYMQLLQVFHLELHLGE